jgi:5-methylcytosine-specific restriction endonuclease McrA
LVMAAVLNTAELETTFRVQKMPYADKNLRRQHQRKWKAERRRRYLSDKVCVKCGTANKLEIDHIDPLKKTSHKIWTWAVGRRNAELQKCQVLCKECHRLKTRKGRAKLDNGKIEEIRKQRKDGASFREIGQRFGISHTTALQIVKKVLWKDV